MKLSALGLAILEFMEEFRAVGYFDSGGVPTAGYGHTGSDVEVGKMYTLEQAAIWLAKDVEHAEDAVNDWIKEPLTQPEFDALVIFTYNVGVHAFAGSTLLHYINAGELTEAAGQLLVWDKVRGIENEGVKRRRRLEKAIFTSGGVP